MITDSEKEVFRVHREEQSKYVYFLLAASGAAIGFTINQTQVLILSYTQIHLGLAILLWGLSFYFGCQQLQFSLKGLYINSGFLDIQKGNDKDVGSNPQMIYAALDIVKEMYEKNSSEITKNGKRQFQFLVLGAISYILWNIIEMIVRTQAVK